VSKIARVRRREPYREINFASQKSETYYSSDIDGMETAFADVTGGITTTKLVDNVTEVILQFGKENFADYRSHFIVSAEFNSVNFIIRFRLVIGILGFGFGRNLSLNVNLYFVSF
jgi:hypothetical protein